MSSEKPNAGVSGGGKTSKPTTKAERRLLQETQRAAKAAKQQQPSAAPPKEETAAKTVDATSKSDACTPFIHLRTFSAMSDKKLERSQKNIHKSFRTFGQKLAQDELGSSNKKCRELLNAITQLIDDFKTPTVEDFPRAFLRNFESHIEFLNVCRPLSLGMLNCSVYVKALLAQVINFEEYKAREIISKSVRTYYNERLHCAQEAILELLRNPSNSLITNNDRILLIGGSSTAFEAAMYLICCGVELDLLMCHDQPVSEHVVDILTMNEQPCVHIPLSDVIYMADQIDKVLLSAVVLFSNGCAITVGGSAQVIEMLHNRGVECILMCETYKIVDDALINSLDKNEIFDLHHMFPLTANTNQLSYIRLRYDLIDAKYISYLVCEKGVFTARSAHSLLQQKLPDPLVTATKAV